MRVPLQPGFFSDIREGRLPGRALRWTARGARPARRGMPHLAGAILDVLS
jgi:hypothetical protein